VRLPVNTQHQPWGYKNSVEHLNARVLKDNAGRTKREQSL